ncbi:hypothetical protein PHLGIDRAFT_384620 [Phlebiopsis gigantea 11061_1 CR5-6]|uniref:Uncharacterized protein n=1 Tax=Phlebiopsis gigantea (strain 11061_1 CR5-6) TaxID=745531 RepID=A0A0C3PN88_PHLG1|nr:hypothetical protein PHLGIDRAFT_384620 [Phlebiopsis gigantea 11061_1 CR5-6]
MSQTRVVYTRRNIAVVAGRASSNPPLAIIPAPEKLSALSKLDRNSRGKLELSKRIYDVRDAFKNILQAALQSAPAAKRSSGHAQASESRIRSLAALCAATVGEHIEDQVQIAREENEEADQDDDEQLKVIDTLYGAVYPHYRKYTIVAHALSIILSICSSDHTLLTVLLDVTITHNLVLESRLLLHNIFRCIIRPSTSDRHAALPICHPAHTRYLTQLLDICCRPHSYLAFNEAAFVNTLSEAYSDSSTSALVDFWTCKAVVRLARVLRSRDYTAFLSMCLSAETFLSSHRELASRRGGKGPSCEHGFDGVAERLGKWLSHACQRLHDTSSSPDPSTLQELAIISDILTRANACQFHRLHWSADADVLTNAIASLSVMCVASPTSAYLTLAALDSCHSILRGVEPKPGLFEILVAIATPQTPENDAPSTMKFLSFTIPVLQGWAHALRSHSYHLLESSLWSSALTHIEGSTPEIGSHYDPASHHNIFHTELERLRCELVRRVEDAERRCFNDRGELQVLSTRTPRKGTLADGEWRWEDLVGCWVQKTPVCGAPALRAKRRRSAREDPPLTTKHARREIAGPSARNAVTMPRRRLSERAASVSSNTTSSTATIVPRRPSMFHRRSSRPSSAQSSATSSRLPTPCDENVLPARPARKKPSSSRRTSNFVSILRDAQVNRIVLHSDRLEDDDGAWLRASGDVMKRYPAITQSDLSEDEADASLDADDHLLTAEHPSSDDVLDLFAYRSSEW